MSHVFNPNLSNSQHIGVYPNLQVRLRHNTEPGLSSERGKLGRNGFVIARQLLAINATGELDFKKSFIMVTSSTCGRLQ